MEWSLPFILNPFVGCCGEIYAVRCGPAEMLAKSNLRGRDLRNSEFQVEPRYAVELVVYSKRGEVKLANVFDEVSFFSF